MMQEVASSDDTNGESTFEFVERKMDDLQLGGGGGVATNTENPEARGLQSSVVVGEDSSSLPPPPSTSVLNPVVSSSTTLPSSVYASTVPPPALLPTFLNSPGSSTSYPSRLSYVVSPFAVTNSPSMMSQPSYVMPTPPNPPLPIQNEPASYGSDGSSTTLDLSAGGYIAPFAHDTHLSGESGDHRSGMWGWIKGTVSGNDFLNKVAEKAKNSVDSMITTLDPQMKQYIYSGGDVDVVVASDKDDKVVPIRESFQSIFGRATVTGMSAQANIAAQPVGYSAGVKGAEDRIGFLRQSGRVHERQPVVAVENFLAELTSERWYDVGCLVLDDPAIGEPIHVYTQATPVPIQYVNMLREETRDDYPLRWSGFAVTIGSIVSRTLQVPRTEWHECFGGVPRRDMIFAASKTLATVYKQRFQGMGSSAARITLQ